ncbi:MAG: helix-turn-helix domain-containing protein [bacterium]
MKRFQMTEEEYRKIEEMVRNTRDGSVRRRLQALMLRYEGHSAVETADMLGMNKSSIYVICHRYEAQGLEEFMRNKYTSNRRLLTKAQEQELLAPLEARARAGEAVIMPDIEQAIREMSGRKVGRAYTYNMLRRNGWRKVRRSPRTDVPGREKIKMCWVPEMNKE